MRRRTFVDVRPRRVAGSTKVAALIAALAAGASATTTAPPPSPAELVAALARATLQPERAVAVANLTLSVDLARVNLVRGWVFPATPVADRTVEMVFVGEGRIEADPVDAVEAGQLELFTGEGRLDRAFDGAAFVVASDAASQAIFRRPPGAPDGAAATRAAALWRDWKGSPERRSLAVDATLLADALGERVYESAFVAWLHAADEPPFVFQIDPVAEEPVNLGRFVPLDADERERRKIARELRSEQKSGRALGLVLDDLGRWEQWMSAPLGTAKGKTWERQTLFEPARYVLEAALSGTGDLTLHGRARVVVRALAAGHRIVVATLHPDLGVQAVRDARGAPLAFHRSSFEIAVILERAPSPGDETVVEIEYEGRFLDRVGRSLYALRDTLAWYPHVGAVDRAAYDVTLSWPKRIEVVAAGERVDGGTRPDGTLWERRRIERPAIGFSFEAGKFEQEVLAVPRAGGAPIAVEVYFDADSEDLPKSIRKEILTAASDSLAYFGQVFSDYRDPTLRIVTVPRWSSQGLPGFVTLSSIVMSDVPGLWRLLLGLDDRRTTVAHEIAHQWWGNRLGWKSYRDQWFSEAMATYSALLWARNRLPEKERPVLGPTFGWQRELLATLEDGRRVESLGPVTLGVRLLGGKEPSAYDAIVYKKGAVVLDMLSRNWKEEDFLRILRAAVEAASDRVVSTSELIAMIDRMTGLELAGFQARFIDGTGLPEIHFRYELGERQNGKWPITIRARQDAPSRFLYSVASGTDGNLTVRRERRAQMEVDATSFVMPFQIPIDAPWPADGGKPPKAKKGDPPPRPRLEGRMLIGGAETEVRLEIEDRPLGVQLDLHQQVFARVFNLELAPKRTALRAALDAAAGADPAQARRRFDEVFAARVRLPTEFTRAEDADDLEREGRELDARARLGLARLALDAGDPGAARRELELATQGLDRAQKRALEAESALLEARLELARGDVDAALRRLRRLVQKQGRIDGAEGWLWLAIAAHRAGDRDTLEKARETATRKGGDIGPLGKS